MIRYLRMPKLYDLPKKGYQCARCGQFTWHRQFPHTGEWVCPCNHRFNEAWAELRTMCLVPRLTDWLQKRRG